MIRGYSDHAANERTFLAWLRTSIAVIAFGFVIEKFNLFAHSLVNAASLDENTKQKLERASGSFPEGAGRVHRRRRHFDRARHHSLCADRLAPRRSGDARSKHPSRPDLLG